jgi:hypothetical protein
VSPPSDRTIYYMSGVTLLNGGSGYDPTLKYIYIDPSQGTYLDVAVISVTVSEAGEITSPDIKNVGRYSVQPTNPYIDVSGATFDITWSNDLKIYTTGLNAGTVDTPYSLELKGAGGTLPYTSWSLVSGALPPGLTLNSETGVISGTPTEAGLFFSFTIKLTDSDDVSVEKELNISTK